MTKEVAVIMARQKLADNAPRSSVSSFVNQLASAKLITEATADTYTDALVADRSGGAAAVLRAIVEALDE